MGKEVGERVFLVGERGGDRVYILRTVWGLSSLGGGEGRWRWGVVGLDGGVSEVGRGRGWGS